MVEVEAQAGKQGWATFMLPSPSEEAQYADAYPPAEPDYTALQPAALLARDEEIVSDMLAEVRTVIGTAKFHAALRVRSCAHLNHDLFPQSKSLFTLQVVNGL